MRSLVGILKVIIVCACLASVSWAVPSGLWSQDQELKLAYTAFPSGDPDDGKFLGISGLGLTLAGIPIIAYIGVEKTAVSFEVGVFDGEIGGLWDITGSGLSSDTRFELYADPMKNGTKDWPIDTWFSSDCADDDWHTKSFPTNATARAPSGNYFYRLYIAWDGPVPNAYLNNFKVRSTGQVSIERDQEFGFNGAPQGGLDPCVKTPGQNTYDGEWRFYFYIPQALEHIEFWDGDSDRVDDTDDPNTYGGGEGKSPGSPGDGPSPYGSCYNIDPSIYYVITDPNGNKYTNNNPSGNMERERFTIGNHADEDYFVNYSLTPGLWEFKMVGMDAHNMNFLRATEEVFSTSDPPLPVNPPPIVEPNHSDEVPGGMTYYYSHNITNKGTAQAFDLKATSFHWSARIYEDTNGNGVHDAGEPEVNATPILGTNETYRIHVAIDVPTGPPGAKDIVKLTASSLIEWAVQNSAYDEVKLQQNQPPNPDAGGPYVASEGSIVHFDASWTYDPDGDPLQFMWDVDDDGTFETGYMSSPYYDFAFGDDFNGTARLRVTDGLHTVEATASVTISNIGPSLVVFSEGYAIADVTFRIAGEKWHDVEFFLY
ncbi:MAG: PKD domain-containing protein, partial [Thermoplasmata archaeon]